MQYYTGAVEDPRPKKEKKKDWQAEELASASSPVWEEKEEWKEYKERNQKRTSSCVPQSVSKALEVNEDVENDREVIFSASKAYDDRSNSGAGSYLHEMLKYAVNNKYTTEERIKSQYLNSDSDMEKLADRWDYGDDKIAKKFGAKAYLMLDYKKTDEIAYWLDQGQAVCALFYFESNEWRAKYPKIKNKSLKIGTALRHCVTIVDYGLIRGKKYFKIEDSAHFGGRSTRWLTEDWFTKRCFGAGFIYDKKNENEEPEPPEFKFTVNTWYGMRNNPEVVALQKELKAEGFFPEAIPCTGNYLEITRQSVEKYQRHYKVASDWELDYVRGRIVGPKTRRFLNGIM